MHLRSRRDYSLGFLPSWPPALIATESKNILFILSIHSFDPNSLHCHLAASYYSLLEQPQPATLAGAIPACGVRLKESSLQVSFARGKKGGMTR
jgi:hypothetical protein